MTSLRNAVVAGVSIAALFGPASQEACASYVSFNDTGFQATDIATFDAIKTGSDLRNYTENNITFKQENGAAFLGFDPAHGVKNPSPFQGGWWLDGSNTFKPLEVYYSRGMDVVQFDLGWLWSGGSAGFAYEAYDNTNHLITSGAYDVSGHIGEKLEIHGLGGASKLILNSPAGVAGGITGLNGLGFDNFGVTAVSAVPEPATYSLALTGLAGVLAAARRRVAVTTPKV